MKQPMVDTKHLLVEMSYPWRRRKFKVRHNRYASSLYLQVMRLEIVVWYR